MSGHGTQIAKAFQYSTVAALLASPHAKTIKLAIAILITLYFGFSFVYNNRKDYRRNREIEKRREEATKKEPALILLDEKLFKLRQAKEDAEKMRETFRVTDKAQSAGIS